MKRILILLALFCWAPPLASAATIVWDGSESTSWVDGDNWTGGSVPGAADLAAFDDDTSSNSCVVDGAVDVLGITLDNYTGTLDLGDTNEDIQIGTSGFAIDKGTVDMGDADVTITGGPFNYLQSAGGGWTTGTGSVTLAGTCTVTGDHAQQLYDFDTGSGTVTIDSATDSRVVVTNICTINGAVVLDDHLAVTGEGDFVINSGASFSGSQRLRVFESNSGDGLTTLHSSVTTPDIDVYKPVAGTRLAAGTYAGNVKLWADGGGSALLELDNGTYDFDGGLELENQGTGLVTLQNKTNAPPTINVTDLTIDLDSTGNIVIDDSGQSVDWNLSGDIVDEETGGGAFSWTQGTGTKTFMGTADQAVDTNSVDIGTWRIVKDTSGKLAINDATLKFGWIDIVGDGSEALVITNSTITANAAAKAFTGASANSADVNFSDAGNNVNLDGADWTITNGDFDYASCGTLAGATSTIVVVGTGTVTGANGKTINDFTVNASGGAITLAGELECADWTHTAGSVDFGGQVVEASGDFSVAAGCTFATGGAGLDGSDITIGGDFSITGTEATNIDMTASAWTLDVTGAATAKWVNVSNSDASAGVLVFANRSMDAGGNAGWIFRRRGSRHIGSRPPVRFGRGVGGN